MQLSLKFAALSSLLAVATARTYEVSNNCPASLKIFYNTQEADIGPQGVFTLPADKVPSSAYLSIGTNAGGSNLYDGESTQFETFTNPPSWPSPGDSYYYIKRGSNFNVGMAVATTGGSTENGFCSSVISCEFSECPDGRRPTGPTFPPLNGQAPAPPLYSCPGDSVVFTIILCPSGTFPAEVSGYR